MELTYPINLIGIEDDKTNGDVLTKDGEYIGTWKKSVTEDGESAILQFTADGQSDPLFTEEIGLISSGLHFGLAMSRLCASIRDWHEEQA